MKTVYTTLPDGTREVALEGLYQGNGDHGKYGGNALLYEPPDAVDMLVFDDYIECLRRDEAAKLWPILKHFADTGRLPKEDQQ